MYLCSLRRAEQNEMQIKAVAPTRIDIVGGTIDIWPIWAIIGGVKTINIAIDLPTEVMVSITSEIPNKANSSPTNVKNTLVDVILDYYKLRYNLPPLVDVKIMSHYPKRAGLAGSSSVVISLISCLDTYLGIKRSHSETINLASNLEASFLKCPTGTQDYYPILFGGINAIHYRLDSIKHESIPVRGDIFESLRDSILLVKSKGDHDSGNLNWTLVRDFINGKENTIHQINLIAEAANLVYNALRDGDIVNFYKGINMDMNARKLLSNHIVPEALGLIADGLVEQDANGAKICGAGGNACLAIFCCSKKRDKIARMIESKGHDAIKAPLRINGIKIQTFSVE